MSGGANCPETPRQKMIGMMYLFLTAMLALNVSKEILNAFVVVNNGLIATNDNFDNKNEATNFAITTAALNDKNNKKIQAAVKSAKSVQEASEKVSIYIHNLRKEVINVTDGLEDIQDSYGDSISLIDVNGKDNYSKPTRYFMGASLTDGKEGPDGIGGKAPELKSELDGFVDFIKNELKGLEIIKETDELGDLGVSTSDPIEQNAEHPEENYWASSNFYNLPLAATVTLLSQMQNQVKNAEASALNMILGSIGASDMKFDELEARVVPKSTYVIQGGNYEADLFVAAWSSTSKPKVIVGPASQLDTTNLQFKPGTDTTQVPVVDGVGKYKVKASSLGDKKYAAVLEVKNTSTGKTSNYALNVGGNYYAEYMVAKPTAVISPTKMNVFYIGVENPVSISVPGFAAENISASGGGIQAKNKAKGEYAIKPKQRGKVQIRVTATDDQGNKTTFPPQEFRVKKVPDPIAKVAGKSMGSIAKSKLVMAGNILAEMENFDFEMKAIVSSFTVSANIGGFERDAKSASYKLTPQQKSIIKKVKKGSRVTFEKIKCKVAGGTRPLRDISLKIK